MNKDDENPFTDTYFLFLVLRAAQTLVFALALILLAWVSI